MNTIELVIKISETTLKNIQKRSTEIQIDGDVLENAVLNGRIVDSCDEESEE